MDGIVVEWLQGSRVDEIDDGEGDDEWEEGCEDGYHHQVEPALRSLGSLSRNAVGRMCRPSSLGHLSKADISQNCKTHIDPLVCASFADLALFEAYKSTDHEGGKSNSPA